MRSILRRAFGSQPFHRAFSSQPFQVPPAHLREQHAITTPLSSTNRVMIIGNPWMRYALAKMPPEPSVAPLVAAIRDLAPTQRPFRIVSHEEPSGRVFNAAFFDDEPTMRNWLEWLGSTALDPSGELHECLAPAAADSSAVPTLDTLLFAAATRVLADTRFGEYQLGMAARYSKYTLRAAAMAPEVAEEVASAEFEQRIADCMQAHGVDYFGRLVMDADDGGAAGGGTIISATRYGSLDDAERGTRAVREMLQRDMERWFVDSATVMGTASRILEL